MTDISSEIQVTKVLPREEDYLSLGEFLKDYRNLLRETNPTFFTQLSIAQKCGYTSSQHISNIERGIALPSLSLANKLIKLYGIPKEDMYNMFMKHREAQYRKAFLAKKK